VIAISNYSNNNNKFLPDQKDDDLHGLLEDVETFVILLRRLKLRFYSTPYFRFNLFAAVMSRL